MRIEIPVLLYATVEDEALDALLDDGSLTPELRTRLFALLEQALGRTGDEPEHQPTGKPIELAEFREARLYLTDHRFPVHSFEGLGLTEE